MDILTPVVTQYVTAFSGYVNQFVEWGQWIFYFLLTVNIVWMTLWYAFDKNSFVESMSDFLRQFFFIALFYTIMMNHGWLVSILQTAKVMGKTLTGIPIDPSSIISNGIAIANKIIIPIHKASIITAGFGLLVGFAAWIVITFTFISIALNLAVTLIITTALITVSTFFMGFAALGATSQIARQALDVVLANCIKLLGIYLTVGVGAKTITSIASAIPTDLQSFDIYTWIIAASLLFWLISKTLPEQLARIVSGSFQAHHGTDAAALTMASVQFARTALSPVRATGGAVSKIAGKAAQGSAINTSASFNKVASLGGSESKSLPNIGDQFKSIWGKINGGSSSSSVSNNGASISPPSGAGASTSPTSGTGAPLSGNSNNTKDGISASTNNETGAATGGASMNPAGAPSSSGRKAASGSVMRSVPRKVKPKK